MAASTLTTIRRRVLRELDLGIYSTSIDSIATGSVTVANLLRNSNWSSNHFQSRETVVYRPDAATSADTIRYAGALTNTSGLLAHTGANYADTTATGESLELWYYGLRPDTDVIDAINRALEFVDFDTLAALTVVADGDVQANNTTSWSAINTATLAKTTTASQVYAGIRALNVQNANANGGARSSNVDMTQGKEVLVAAIVQVTSGTFDLVLRNVTGSASFGTAVTTTERGWQYVWRRETVPSACKQLAVDLVGEEATAVFNIGAVFVYPIQNSFIDLPSWSTEEFKVAGLSRSRFEFTTASGVEDARSLVLDDMAEDAEYGFSYNQADANPYRVNFFPYGGGRTSILSSNFWSQWPIYIRGRRPYSDLITLAAEADTTSAPLHLLIPRVKMELLASVLIPRFPSNQKWPLLYARAEQEFQRAIQARPVSRPSRPLLYISRPASV